MFTQSKNYLNKFYTSKKKKGSVQERKSCKEHRQVIDVVTGDLHQLL